MSTTKPAIGHDRLAHLLADHLAVNSNRMIWEDIKMGPSGSVRPDVYTMMKSFQSPQPTAYEIKVSVSDFRSDVTSGKWMRYLEFAQSVTFCVPKGLITKADVPHEAGLIIWNPDTGDFRTVKKATLRRLDQLPTSLMMKLLIDGTERQREIIRVREFNSYKQEKEIAKRNGEQAAAVLRDMRHAEFQIEQANLRAEGIRKNAQRDAERFREQYKEEQQKIDGAWQELGDLLGVRSRLGQVSRFEITNRIRELKSEAQQDAAVKDVLSAANRAIQQLQQVAEITNFITLKSESAEARP